jgi:hypothetical protein
LGADRVCRGKCRDWGIRSLHPGIIVTPVIDRLHLPFVALAFSAVVSMMPGFFLFNAATGLVELVSIGPSAPAALPTSIATSGATAFLIIMAMTLLILPRIWSGA